MLNRFKKTVESSVKRFKNRKLMEATVALCARVALADGVIESAEKQKMIGYLSQSPELNVFETGEVIAFFEKITASYAFDKEIGKGESMKYILAIKDDPELTQLAVRVGIAIAKSDGSFDEAEKNELREIIHSLNLPPSQFDI